jgi:dihydroorotate dehydrogenase (NAD+) catalytic subunit
VPIIGQGGICSPDDALEFIIAGSTTVGVGTSLFYEPHSCRRINAGIAEYLGANKMTAVSELIGSLDAPKKVVQACAC